MKILLNLIIMMCVTTLVYGAKVTDNGKGDVGDILINKNGSHKGKWVDPSTVSGLKGDKGDKGDTGATGAVDQGTLNNINSGISNNSDRISELEKTQFILSLGGRLYDSKKWQVNSFVDFSTTRSKVDRVGIRFTYKFGKSYEETLIENHERRLRAIEERLRITTEWEEKQNLGYAVKNYKVTVQPDGTHSFTLKY